MLHNIKAECNYHDIVNSTQMSETESWKLLLSKFFLNNQLIQPKVEEINSRDDVNIRTDTIILQRDNQLEPMNATINKNSDNLQYNNTLGSITPHSNLTSSSNNSLTRPKSSISRESWPNTSDDGSISRHTPESSFEEFTALKSHEFLHGLNDNSNNNGNSKFLKSLLVGGDPNQIKSYSSLLTSRVAMCNNLNFLEVRSDDPEVKSEIINLDDQTNGHGLMNNNKIDDMLLYLLKFLRNKMEHSQSLPRNNNNDNKQASQSNDTKKTKAQGNYTDGSLLANLINENDNFEETGEQYVSFQLCPDSQNELKIIERKISNEYSSLFKLTGHSKSIVSRNLEARLTILEMLRSRKRLKFERTPKAIANGLPMTIVHLFKTVLDNKIPLISQDDNIFQILQSAVISQECYPRIVTNTCQSIMQNLHEYLEKIGSPETFIDFLLLMTNINSINLSHFHILYSSLSLLPSKNLNYPTTAVEQQLLTASRKRRASKQYFCNAD